MIIRNKIKYNYKEIYNLLKIPLKKSINSKMIDSILFFNSRPCFDFVGDNWNEECSQKPIAILWGFNPWKRQHLSNFLSEYRTIYVFGNSSWLRTLKNIENIPAEAKIVFFSWSFKAPKSAENYAKRKKIEFVRIEDGFLRSTAPGLKHTKPMSLSFDKTGIYFDSRSSSDLEDLICSSDVSKNKTKKEEVATAIDLFRAMKLTKYYDTADQENPKELDRESERKRKREEERSFFEERKNKNSYSILVLGQVEDDCSILFGAKKQYKNSDIVEKAKLDFPKAEIYFRPHPDVLHGNRKSRSKMRSLAKIATIVDEQIPLYNLFEGVDHVYTITSLSGFEALLNGKKVTTLGSPFYSNWGITCDKENIKRRKSKKSIEDIFSATYLEYIKYIHPISNEEISYFEMASYFFIEKIKYLDLFTISSCYADFEIIEKHKNKLTSCVSLFYYLQKTNRQGEADSEEVMKIVRGTKNKPHDLRDFPQISQLLINTGNYDCLKDYTNFCLKDFDLYDSKIIKDQELFYNFFSYLSLVQKNLNGRVLNEIPDLSKVVHNGITSKTNFKQSLFIHYFKVVSNNIHYDLLEGLVKSICAIDVELLSAGFLQKICGILSSKPTRSERMDSVRSSLLHLCADKYKDVLNLQFTSTYDVHLNSALYGMAVEDKKIVSKSFYRLKSMFKDEDLNFSHEKFKSFSDLKIRKKTLPSIYDFFIKHGEFNETEELVECIELLDQQSVKNGLLLQYYLKISNYSKFIDKYNSLLPTEKNEQRKLFGYVKSLKAMGEFKSALEILRTYKSRAITPDKRLSVEIEINKVEFIIKSSEILKSYPQPKFPKGVVFISSQNCFNTMAMLIPSLIEVKKRGYAIVNLMEGMIQAEPTGIDFIDKFESSIPLNFHKNKFFNEWKVDWENRIVECDSINYYQGLYERLSTQHRKFFIDINERALNKDFYANLRRCDYVLHINKNIFNEVVKGQGLPVAFISGNSHVSPFSVVRDFCMNKNHAKMTFINANVAYESYFSNVGSNFSSTMALCDMTLQPFRRAPFLPDREEFCEWYEKNKNEKEFLEKANSMINVNRSGAKDNSKSDELIEQIETYKEEGKKILCLFGKVPVDIACPFDGGPAHIDMADWINHTISFINKMEDDVVLYIKPHPHEVKPSIALDLVTPLRSLIKIKPNKNVFILDHKDINGHQLAPYIDLAILWNGSSLLELTAQGIPTLQCSYFAKYDYPIDLRYPDDRIEYEEYIKLLNFKTPDMETRKKAAFMISYMGTGEITIINQYSKRQLTNDKIGVPVWNEQKIAEFLKNGDPEMSRAAYKIVRKFEPLYGEKNLIKSKILNKTL